jgi:hypothetical protein
MTKAKQGLLHLWVSDWFRKIEHSTHQYAMENIYVRASFA